MVTAKDVHRLRGMIELMTDVIWLTNNFIAHQSPQHLGRGMDMQKKAVNVGLNQTYIRLI